jgi:CheY-like chemotaxis protein
VVDDRVDTVRILVVEDDFGLRDLVAAVFELDPFVRTVKAENGEHAPDMVRTMRPDLVILDTRPPKLGGLEVARRLKADPQIRAIPLVGVTSEPLPETMNGTCDYYVTRPYDLVETVARLREHLAAKPEPRVAA